MAKNASVSLADLVQCLQVRPVAEALEGHLGALESHSTELSSGLTRKD
jgi:hypothetical protein